MATDFLDLELRLLLAKYGRARLIAALAQLENATVEDIELRLRKLAQARPPSKGRRRISIEEALDRLKDSDKQRPQLLVLAREFQNKRFLPQLRDVVRFCAQHGQRIRPKSRLEALPAVLGILARFSESQLSELQASLDKGGEGSYARLADAIIRGAGPEPRSK